MAWILALSTLNSLYQLSLPQWVKARGMSFYLVVFQGGSAVGSVAFGVAAQRIGLSPALLAAAAGLALSPLAGLRYRFQTIPAQDLLPAGDWRAPNLAADGPPGGPVMVSVEYRALPEREDELLAALQDARFAGAVPEQVPGEPGKTAASPIGSWSSSSSPRGRSTSGSTPASPRGTSKGTTRYAR